VFAFLVFGLSGPLRIYGEIRSPTHQGYESRSHVPSDVARFLRGVARAANSNKHKQCVYYCIYGIIRPIHEDLLAIPLKARGANLRILYIKLLSSVNTTYYCYLRCPTAYSLRFIGRCHVISSTMAWYDGIYHVISRTMA